MKQQYRHFRQQIMPCCFSMYIYVNFRCLILALCCLFFLRVPWVPKPLMLTGDVVNLRHMSGILLTRMGKSGKEVVDEILPLRLLISS